LFFVCLHFNFLFVCLYFCLFVCIIVLEHN
jgi:hypothetical protein